MYLEKEATADVWALGSRSILVYLNVKLIIDIVTGNFTYIEYSIHIALEQSFN
uniref:Uncharacterized protein n=1 Tax=Anguilla anguilla TaxID=7936 RepID=A0A0E9VJ60_ANGAN